MMTIIHAMFGVACFMLVLTFLLASLVSEIWYPGDTIAQVRSQIFHGMLMLLPILLIATVMGISLGKNRKEKIIDNKKRRIFWIFVIYCLVFLPTAYLLEQFSRAGLFNSIYFLAQLIEYVFDLIVLALLALNFRDGGRLVAGDIERSNQEFFARTRNHE